MIILVISNLGVFTLREQEEEEVYNLLYSPAAVFPGTSVCEAGIIIGVAVLITQQARVS